MRSASSKKSQNEIEDNGLELSRIISEDLADGKVAQKDQDLRLLRKDLDPSIVTEGTDFHRKSWAITRLSSFLRPTETEPAHPSFRAPMSPPPLSSPLSNKRRKLGEHKLNATIEPTASGQKILSQTFAQKPIANLESFMQAEDDDAAIVLVRHVRYATKELIRALVAVRISQRGVKQGLGNAGKRIDIVAGKGNGLIMLLHGGPGTGKSLTAESVAEIAEMPLYRVMCGDMGATPAEVENYLAAVMYLGTTWDCVLLLDEADVFLEERSVSDFVRNSLVSVFLRILEYYDGTLILTSNRVGVFDEAFKSRIQVALHYQNLTRSSRRQIWTNFIEMVEEDDEDANYDELRLHLGELAGYNLNGRQIRNTLTTARELAMFRVERLDWKHIQLALKVSNDFSDYLQNMHGHTDDENARDRQLR
ncbi:MAG: hypothetical protein Q9219_000521 [cf. Caloplaca sp. 3 TL-2023]